MVGEDGSARNRDVMMAAVVIGRNEAAILRSSLESVKRAGLKTVYVDSGSSDGSPMVARQADFPTIDLDTSRPFSAARARNEGLAEVIRRWPDVVYVLFLDGDCVLDASFPEAAIATLASNPDCAVVFGHLSEREPDRSIYNRLCSIEWRSPPGRLATAKSLGGIMVVRVDAFEKVNGFNEEAIAGEEPDFGSRLMLAGHSIIKVDVPMASHDARMHRFSQWWWRSVRAGYAMAHGCMTHGHTPFREGVRETRSALFWGLLLPVLVAVLLWPTRGWSLLFLLSYIVLSWRIFRHYRATGLSVSDGLLMARFLVYAKFAEVIGIARYAVNRVRGQVRIIEYK